jgi:selenophosphate synthetase-related protein
MPETRLAVAFLLCASVLQPAGSAIAQDVKSTFDKSVDFGKYRKYMWGSNYLLTAQPKDVQRNRL